MGDCTAYRLPDPPSPRPALNLESAEFPSGRMSRYTRATTTPAHRVTGDFSGMFPGRGIAPRAGFGSASSQAFLGPRWPSRAGGCRVMSANSPRSGVALGSERPDRPVVLDFLRSSWRSSTSAVSKSAESGMVAERGDTPGRSSRAATWTSRVGKSMETPGLGVRARPLGPAGGRCDKTAARFSSRTAISSSPRRR